MDIELVTVSDEPPVADDSKRDEPASDLSIATAVALVYDPGNRDWGVSLLVVLSVVALAILIWYNSSRKPSNRVITRILIFFIFLNVVFGLILLYLEQYVSAISIFVSVGLLAPFINQELDRDSLLVVGLIISLLGGVAGLYGL